MNCKIHHWNAKQAKKDGKPLTWIDRIIMLRSELTHSEFQFSERYGGVSWSFTLAEGAKGCRFKMIYYSHPKRWETDVIPLTDEEEDKIWKEACRLADTWMGRLVVCEAMSDCIIRQGPDHARYDLPGILTHATKKAKKWWVNVVRWGVWWWTKFVKPDPEKMWCSEGCAHQVKLVYEDFDGRPDSLDPQELHLEDVKYFKEAENGD